MPITAILLQRQPATSNVGRPLEEAQSTTEQSCHVHGLHSYTGGPVKLPDIKVVMLLNLYFMLIYQTEFVVMARLACRNVRF